MAWGFRVIIQPSGRNFIVVFQHRSTVEGVLLAATVATEVCNVCMGYFFVIVWFMLVSVISIPLLPVFLCVLWVSVQSLAGSVFCLEREGRGYAVIYFLCLAARYVVISVWRWASRRLFVVSECAVCMRACHVQLHPETA